jgi:CubicO group peptidase (beta-lactamase class C family)
VQIKQTLFLLLLPLIWACSSTEEANEKENEGTALRYPVGSIDTTSAMFLQWQADLDSHFEHLHRYAKFNGCVLIAREGVVIYRNCFGVMDLESDLPLQENHLFQIASVSKTFTAMAVLKLWDEGKIGLDQNLSEFFPNIPYPAVTVHDLLSHRSGLPNYLVATEDAWKHSEVLQSNDDLLAFLIKEQPAILASPGRKFAYNNTNYALLALIIEQASGKSYADYMTENIFRPLGMKSTLVFGAGNDSLPQGKTTTGYLRRKNPDVLVPVDGIVGDKNIYSTVDDLLIWERAVTHDYFFSRKVLDTAAAGQSFEKPGRKNYGYGWRLLVQDDGGNMVYHNGWWHGYTAAFYRNPKDETVVIALSNIYNRSTYKMQPVWDILYGTQAEMEFDQ